MADPIKRVHYFDYQFLRVEDFTCEQEYHVARRRLHNRVLHTPGIAQGLEVEYEQGASEVTIRPGTAVDREGREIVLTKDQPWQLPDWTESQEYWLTIAYDEEMTDRTEETGAEGDTRWTETPVIEWSKDPGQKVVLARISRSNSNINVDSGEDVRKTAGAKLGDTTARQLTLSRKGVDPTQWPALSCGAAGRADLTGDLSVSGNVGIGTKTPDTLLTVGDGTNRDLLKFVNTAKGWRFTASGSGADTTLDLQALEGGKSFRVVSHDGTRVPLQVHTSDAEERNAVYLVQNGGNVGIGTTSPQAKLDVNGDLRVSGPFSAPSSLGTYFDKVEKWQNDTTSGQWTLLTEREISLSARTHVLVLGHCHGITSDGGTALDFGIFIDGYDPPDPKAVRGVGLTHSTTWVPIVAVTAAVLDKGDHTIELKFRSRGGRSVSCSGVSMATMVLGSV